MYVGIIYGIQLNKNVTFSSYIKYTFVMVGRNNNRPDWVSNRPTRLAKNQEKLMFPRTVGREIPAFTTDNSQHRYFPANPGFELGPPESLD